MLTSIAAGRGYKTPFLSFLVCPASSILSGSGGMVVAHHWSMIEASHSFAHRGPAAIPETLIAGEDQNRKGGMDIFQELPVNLMAASLLVAQIIDK